MGLESIGVVMVWTHRILKLGILLGIYVNKYSIFSTQLVYSFLELLLKLNFDE